MGFGRNVERDPEVAASASHAMLRELGRARGSGGADGELAAWIILACSSSDASTVAAACAQALARGERVDGLAEWAIESDAPLALAWCVEFGPMEPATPLRAGRSESPTFKKSLAAHALSRQSTECVEYLEGRFPGLRARSDSKSWTKTEADAAEHCAKISALHALRAVARARGGLSGADAQGALGWAVARCGSSYGVSDPPEELVAQLVAWGARLDAPADCEGLHDQERSAPMTLGHAVAGRYLSPMKGELKTWEGRRSARAAWELVVAAPGWARWSAGGGAPLGLWALAATCALASDVDPAHAGEIRRAAREAFGARACLAALARPMWSLALAGDKGGLSAMERFEMSGDDDVDALAPAEIVSMVARACPGSAQGLHWPGTAAALVAGCDKLHGLCRDGGAREALARARALCALGTEPAAGRDKERERALWEALALSAVTFESGTVPARPGTRL